MKFPLSSVAVTLATAATLATATNITVQVTPPALKGAPATINNTLDTAGSYTDASSIVSTVNVVNQKSGATDSSPPGQAASSTVITADNGQLTTSGSLHRREKTLGHSSRGLNKGNIAKRLPYGFTQVFSGSRPGEHDASIEGTAYLTYSLVPNSTYNVDACLDFCDQVDDCVFVNLYYEYNNPLLDFVFSEKSNLKCAAYGDIHTAAEKTNTGGQQLEALPAGLTYISQSSGYALPDLAEPPVPAGYELVYGPVDGANNAPGYMGFVFLDKYDTQACADLCNTRGADPNGGACQYFNIWRALVDGIPTTYTCSMYFIPADETTAVNYGQGDLKVTFSRGYKRMSVLPDGGFEGYTCADGSDFCFTDSYSSWFGKTPADQTFDASIFFYVPYAHSGHGVALLGSAFGTDSGAGVLTAAKPLSTVAGKTYTISFFHSSSFSGSLEINAFVDVMWNGKIIGSIHPGFQGWTYYSFTANGSGSDILSFHGGAAPAYDFIDDVTVFES